MFEHSRNEILPAYDDVKLACYHQKSAQKHTPHSSQLEIYIYFELVLILSLKRRDLFTFFNSNETFVHFHG